MIGNPSKHLIKERHLISGYSYSRHFFVIFPNQAWLDSMESKLNDTYSSKILSSNLLLCRKYCSSKLKLLILKATNLLGLQWLQLLAPCFKPCQHRLLGKKTLQATYLLSSMFKIIAVQMIFPSKINTSNYEGSSPPWTSTATNFSSLLQIILVWCLWKQNLQIYSSIKIS